MIEKERTEVIRRIQTERDAGTSSEFDERVEWDLFHKRCGPMQREIDLIVDLLAQKTSL